MGQFRIGEIEEILLNAFPSVDREIYDGWILNFSSGYTYRANCIYPFYASSYDLKDKIRHCETQYRELFLPAVYLSEEAIQRMRTSVFLRLPMNTKRCFRTRTIPRMR